MNYKQLCSELLERTKERNGTYRDAAVEVSKTINQKAPFIKDCHVHGNYFTHLKRRGFTKMIVTILAVLEVAGYEIRKKEDE